MSPQRKPKNADERANEALDRVTSGATPARRTLDFLLKGSHDDPAQSQPVPSPIPAQTEPSPKVAQSQSNPRPIAPERNYNKRANSLEHSALPLGLFPGASKKIYDALYVRTRGAIQPTRTVQAKHRELMVWASIKDVKTVKTHLNKLREQGLLAWQTLKGEHEGSFYEVFLPEEVSPDPAQSSARPSPNLKTDSDQAQNLDWAGLPKTVDSQTTSEFPKTSFKTNTEKIDDEAMPTLRARAGRLPKTEAVLLSLLDILEGRTDVSSPDALLAHVLARKLAPRATVGQRRANEEQFRGSAAPVEVTDEDLAEYERNRAELSKT